MKERKKKNQKNVIPSEDKEKRETEKVLGSL